MSPRFSPDGQSLASGDSGYGEDAVNIWQVGNGQLLRSLRGHIDSVVALAYSRDGEVLASGSGDATIRLWDPATGDLREMLTRGVPVRGDLHQFHPPILLPAWAGTV